MPPTPSRVNAASVHTPRDFFARFKLMDSLYSALLGAGVPSVACIILCWLVWRQLTADSSARKRLEEKVTTLETEKFSRLEKRVEAHIAADKGPELLNEMKHLNGNVEKLTTQVTRALETNAGQAADIENNKRYIDNLRDDLQDHIKDCNRRNWK